MRIFSPVASRAAGMLPWLLASVLGAGSLAAQELTPSAPPVQLAAGIARTMTATTPRNPLVEQTFSSHENVVEWRTQIKASDGYQKTVENRSGYELANMRFMCQPSRIVFIKRGVVFHVSVSGPKAGESFEYVIDERACESLPKPAHADAATLAALAADIARTLGAEGDPLKTTNGVRTEKPTAQDGVVRIVNVIVAPAFVDFFKMKSSTIRGVAQGWLCARFGDALRRGVQVRVTYQLEDEPPLFEFVADKTVC